MQAGCVTPTFGFGFEFEFDSMYPGALGTDGRGAPRGAADPREKIQIFRHQDK